MEKTVARGLQAGKHGTSEGVNKLIGRGMSYPVEAWTKKWSVEPTKGLSGAGRETLHVHTVTLCLLSLILHIPSQVRGTLKYKLCLDCCL